MYMYIVCRHSGYTVGIKGVVTDENNEPVEGAEVRVAERLSPLRQQQRGNTGDYYYQGPTR